MQCCICWCFKCLWIAVFLIRDLMTIWKCSEHSNLLFLMFCIHYKLHLKQFLCLYPTNQRNLTFQNCIIWDWHFFPRKCHKKWTYSLILYSWSFLFRRSIFRLHYLDIEMYQEYRLEIIIILPLYRLMQSVCNMQQHVTNI